MENQYKGSECIFLVEMLRFEKSNCSDTAWGHTENTFVVEHERHCDGKTQHEGLCTCKRERERTVHQFSFHQNECYVP